METRILLRMEAIEYSYGSSLVLNGVDFTLYEGEIHALAGDHRAGKTTMGKILSGAVRKQKGKIFINGEEIHNLTIRRAIQLGIGMVYQGETLIPSLNAIDNIYCGIQQKFFIDRNTRRSMGEESRRLLDLFDVSIPLDEPFYKLDERKKQIIYICHVLSRNPRIIVIDEIGNSLPPAELDLVFSILRHKRDRGVSVIYITSNFNEVFKIADRVTILKDGCRKGTEDVRALDPARLIDMAYTSVQNTQRGPKGAILFDSFQESIIDELPIGEIILDNAKQVIFVNRQAAKLLKPLRTDYRGKELTLVFPQLGKANLDRIDALSNAESACDLHDIIVGDRMLKLTFGPILTHWKQRVGTNVFIEDVSFTYQTKEYLIEANKAASVAALAAGVAHEIKNPLAIISNYVELLKISSDSKENRQNLSRIDSELKRITEIIGSLLSFSRIKQTTFSPNSLRILLEEVLMLLSHKISQKRIEILTSFENDPILYTDENKLKQLFMNLIVNAIDAVLDEGRIRVAVIGDTTDRSVSILISDNGHGIPSDVREKIFAPFFTTKMNRTNIGLGLAICQNIVELHKGVMKLVNVPGWKTTFMVSLPLGPRRDEG